MEMMDARGQRVTHTGITPMAGMTAVGSDEVDDPAARVKSYGDDADQAQSTLELDHIDASTNGVGTGTMDGLVDTPNTGAADTGTKKTKIVKQPQRPILFGMGRDRLILVGVAALIVLAALAGGSLLLNRNRAGNIGVPATATAAPLPTPTGFGDPTATVPPAPTATVPPPPPSDVIAIGGWVQATSNLTLRAEPNTGGARLGVLQKGDKAHVIDGPQQANGYTWWKVDSYDPNDPGASAWCAGEFLAPIPPP
jgi:hypothetical protein